MQVEQDANIHTRFPQVLGIAHIQVHAYDFDPSHPVSSFQQQSDQVSVSCTSLSTLGGDDPCAEFPQGQTGRLRGSHGWDNLRVDFDE